MMNRRHSPLLAQCSQSSKIIIRSSLIFVLLVIVGVLLTPNSALANTSIKYGWIALDSNKTPVLQGTQYPLTGTVKPVAYISNGKDIAVVNSKAVVYLKNTEVGTAQALIIGKNIPGYQDAFITTFTIVKAPAIVTPTKKDISKLADCKIGDQSYTGNPIHPAFTLKDGNTTLKEKKDYTVKWGTNVNAGTGIVTLTGIGDYTGTKTLKFKITAIPVSALTIDSISSFKYTGKPIEPALSIKYKKKTLAKSKDGKSGDYTVKYSNNIKIGTALATVTFRGNYTGSKTIKFKILPQHFSMKGKKAIVFGDSIQTPKYGEFIIYECKKLGATKATNYARGGAMVANRNGSNNIQHQIAKAKSNGTLGKYDYYFIAAGTNDCAWGSHSLGKKTDKTDQTVCGGMNKAIKAINSAHEKATGYKAKIIVITPTGRQNLHKKLEKYRQGIKATAEQYDYVRVINGTSISTNKEHATLFNSVHPTATFARKTMAPRLGKQLDKHIEWLVTRTKAKK